MEVAPGISFYSAKAHVGDWSICFYVHHLCYGMRYLHKDRFMMSYIQCDPRTLCQVNKETTLAASQHVRVGLKSASKMWTPNLAGVCVCVHLCHFIHVSLALAFLIRSPHRRNPKPPSHQPIDTHTDAILNHSHDSRQTHSVCWYSHHWAAWTLPGVFDGADLSVVKCQITDNQVFTMSLELLPHLQIMHTQVLQSGRVSSICYCRIVIHMKYYFTTTWLEGYLWFYFSAPNCAYKIQSKCTIASKP